MKLAARGGGDFVAVAFDRRLGRSTHARRMTRFALIKAASAPESRPAFSFANLSEIKL